MRKIKLFIISFFLVIVVTTNLFYSSTKKQVSGNNEKVQFVLPEEYKFSKKDLEIVFIDVGQGDCSFIKTPSGNTMLIDAGGSSYWLGPDAWDPGENVIVPYLKSRNIKKIDYVIISHPHGDHFGGIFAVLNKLKIKNFIDNGFVEGDQNYKDVLELVDNKEIPYDQLKENDIFEIDKGIMLKTFFPPKNDFPYDNTNNTSIVFKLTYEKFSILFTGDIEAEVENYICSKHKTELSATVLKVPHHGSRTSSTMRFIKTVNPQVGIILCGKNNIFGHPHNEVVSRYNKLNIDLYTTANDGTIIVFTNGKTYTVKISNEDDE